MNPGNPEQILMLELRAGSLVGGFRGETFEMVVERGAEGLMTPAARQAIKQSLEDRLGKSGVKSGARAVVLLGSRGVSVREISVPERAENEIVSLLTLKLESELPIPPDQLAWGWQFDPTTNPAVPGDSPREGQKLRSCLVAAVRKEVLEDLSALLSEVGLQSEFVLACMARARLVPAGVTNFGLLEVGSHGVEVSIFKNGLPRILRNLVLDPQSETSRRTREIVQAVQELSPGLPIYVLQVRSSPVDSAFCKSLIEQGGTTWKLLESRAASDGTVAFGGLESAIVAGSGERVRLLTLRAALQQPVVTPGSSGLPWKPFLVPACLLGLIVALPYIEAAILKPKLSREIKALQKEKPRLALIDQQYTFLQHLRKHQPPYIEALYLIAKNSPGGWKIENISMNRKGEIGFRATFRDPQQVDPFRTKMIDTGFFSSVVVDEQTVSPDRQKVTLKVTAQWKDVEDRAAVEVGPTDEELEKLKPPVKGTNSSPATVGKTAPAETKSRAGDAASPSK